MVPPSTIQAATLRAGVPYVETSQLLKVHKELERCSTCKNWTLVGELLLGLCPKCNT